MQFHNISIKKDKLSEIVGVKVEPKEAESPILSEPTYIGEEKNQNIHTRVEGNKETGFNLREENRRFKAFKEKAEETYHSFQKNRDSLTASLIKGLDDEGLEAENSEAELIEKNVESILKNRDKKRENLEKQVENLSESRKEIERMAMNLPEGETKAVIERLQKSGLPLTKANVMKFMAGAELAAKVVDGLDDKTMYHTILGNDEETIENLYKWEGVPENKNLIQEEESLWKEMETKALSLLTEQGVPEGEETREAAKWLFQKKLDLNTENVAHFMSLKALKKDGMTPEGREEILGKIAETMAEGKEPVLTEIGTEKLIRARFTIHYFKTTVEQKSVFHEISAKRQIEEIRLKLTEEVALKMLHKGIKLDVNNLKGLVEELRKEEESYFNQLVKGDSKQAVQHNGNQIGESQLQIFKETLSIRSYHFKAEAESSYRYESLSFVYRKEETATLRAYHKAGLAYENGGTEVRADLGDSIKKAFSNIDEILKFNHLSLTEENRKAVRLLAYNKAEINPDNLLQMKKASLLTEEVFAELKPATVARLIKEGENPLDLPMEELLSKLKEINEELKPTEEKMATYLFKLEKNGEIGEKEREAYIGIYRLLTKIEKGDMAAVGATELAGKELTLRHFLEMERTRKQGLFDVKMTEDMGKLSAVLSENRIDRQIERGYAKLLAGKVKREAELSDEEYLKERESLIKEANVELTDVERLIEAGEKVSHSTLVAQTEIRNGRKGLRHLVLSMDEGEKEEIKTLAEESLLHADEEKLEKNTKKIQESLLKKATELMEEKTGYQELKRLIGTKNMLSLSIKRSETASYDLPLIYDEDKYADLSLTIRKANKASDSGKVDVKLSLEETEIQLSFRVSGDRVSGLVMAERREDLNLLKKSEKALLEIVEELDLTGGDISYHLTKASSLFRDNDDIYSGKAETKKLYRLAKKMSAYLLKEMGIR